MEVKLLFGVHSHQPVGNFNHVMEWAYQRAYRPFTEVVSRFPEFKFTVHFTGPLLEWLESHHPEFIDLLAELIDRGQAEFVVSGFYEPVLAAIPYDDRVGQIEMAKEYARKRFGVEPEGLWLTERVWESEVVPALLETGIRYVVVDDYHFLCVGKDLSELHGYFLTEFEGRKLAIFPIDQKLRYLTPFRPLDEVFDYLATIRKASGDGAIIFDDGEKFGIWPGTHSWVYERKWLEDFVKRTLETDWLTPTTYGGYLKANKPLGRIYLPTASYFEMGEWSLPADKAVEFQKFVRELEKLGDFERYRKFVRGGIWRNFLVKYEEANRMHKKMLEISKLVAQKGDQTARKFLYKGQCNDAYWHGVFGGLYLPHLRHAVYENLIEAEKIVADKGIKIDDFDCDGYDEVRIRTDGLSIWVIPRHGGGIAELSLFKHRFNLADTLMRRFEHYHRGIKLGSRSDKGVSSIHEIEKIVDERTYRALRYDWYQRLMFIEHFIDDRVTLDDFRNAAFYDLGNFALEPFDFEVDDESVVLSRKGMLKFGAESVGLALTKRFSAYGTGISATYNLQSDGDVLDDVKLGVELNLALPYGDSPGTSVKFDGKAVGSARSEMEAKDVETIEILDSSGLELEISANHPFNLWIVPIYTVSQSESGFDLTYQATAILMSWYVKGLLGVPLEIEMKVR